MNATDEHTPTLEQKVGQLFHVGFHGHEPSEELETLVRTYHVGGVIYFARNLRTPEQTRTLSRSLQGLALECEPRWPLFLSVDQEGGIVRRLPYYAEPPGQMAVGATDDPATAATLAETTATHLRRVGINCNLAPVLDVNNNPDNPVIGVRSYGETPQRVGRFASRYVEALQGAGVMACGKHFPGHGDTETDSHATLPRVDADEARLERVEFPPFERAIDVGIDAIMTAHVAFPAITGAERTPATLSRSVLTDCLRTRLGFDGLVITDCMEMNAITETIGTTRGAVEAIRAGADAVLISHTYDRQRRAIEAVIDAVEEGTIPASRIDDAFERTIRIKRRRLSGFGATPTSEYDDVTVDTPADRRRFRSIAREAVTLVRGGEALPLAVDEPLSLVAAHNERASPAEDEQTYVDTLEARLTERGFDVSVFALGESDAAVPIDPSTIPATGSLLCCTVDLGRNPTHVDAVRALLEAGLEPIVVGVRNPYDVLSLPSVSTFLTTYDPTSENLAALVEVLAGDRPARGRVLPSLRDERAPR